MENLVGIFVTGFPTTQGGNCATRFDERKGALAGRTKPTDGPLTANGTTPYKLSYAKMKFVILNFLLLTKVVLGKSTRAFRRNCRHIRGKKVKLSLCLIKHDAMKTYGGVDV
jgi:hypothetical protein